MRGVYVDPQENPNVLPRNRSRRGFCTMRSRDRALLLRSSLTVMILGTRSASLLRIALCVMALVGARQAAADTINVEWDPTTEPVGYKVHVGVQPGTYTQHFDVGSATLFAYTNATAGQRYCFTVSAYLLSSQLEGPLSSEVCGYSNMPPTLANPGNQSSTTGQPVTLQLQGSDPDLQPLTYSATGLPEGLSIQPSTGYISGTGTKAGTHSVTARASDGQLTASRTFTWTMTAPAPTPDTTLPTISITSPTSNSTLSTTSSSITLGGTAADNVGVVQVKWTINGNVYVAAGTTSWSTSAIALAIGSNVITVTAVDAAGNQGAATLTVTRTTTVDTTLPTVSIATPTTGTTFFSTSASINLTGNASDNAGVTQVSWASDRGGNGVASGTTSWAIGLIPLQTGANIITVMAIDAAGNAGSDTLTVSYSEPTASTVTLTAQRSGSRTASLSWGGASWSRVKIYRNGAIVKEMRNNGSANDNVPKGAGTYDYRVCAADSATNCSNTARVSIF
jgi:hypothetical protein